MEKDTKKLFSEAIRPLTVYLGESGAPHDTKRVDILPSSFNGTGRRLAISVGTTGLVINDITNPGETREVWRVEYDELPE